MYTKWRATALLHLNAINEFIYKQLDKDTVRNELGKVKHGE